MRIVVQCESLIMFVYLIMPACFSMPAKLTPKLGVDYPNLDQHRVSGRYGQDPNLNIIGYPK